ncbi:MAG: plasmid pRiA4b ORF-3 family protein [Leptolyngbya sp. SIOISBB]|nr:plasmid pRiA4b ORF-3 family protein [Leptolyngbya sp. SIOISBB]
MAPLTESFVRKNPRIARTIVIKGEQSLQELHQVIFAAFDREEGHRYEFQVGGDGPDAPDCRRYGLASLTELDYAGDVPQTTINDLNLEKGEMFGYTFDFGDDWWHVLEVKAIRSKAPKGKYPQVTERVGQSPPQYADFD